MMKKFKMFKSLNHKIIFFIIIFCFGYSLMIIFHSFKLITISDKSSNISHLIFEIFGSLLICFCIYRIHKIKFEEKGNIKALEESEEKFRTLVEILAEGVSIVNPNEEFVFVNPVAEKIFEVNQGELIGKNLSEFLSNEDYKKIKTETEKRKNGMHSNYELEITTKTGSKKNILVSAAPKFDDKNNFIGTFGVFRDITKQKKYEEQIITYSKELKEINATKDKFFSIIAHDLRNPFCGILGFSELLLENLKNNDVKNTVQFIEFINKSAKSTLILLENLLSWAKSQTGKLPFKPIKLSLKTIIQEVTEILKSSAQIKNISLNYYISDKIQIYADENMLKSILQNLISNAIKYTHTGGKIDIFEKINKDQIEITISDNGIGMNEETKNNLFKIEANLTTLGTANEKGSGLGLILCKDFVVKHGGKIWVESELGKGSEFKFTMPLCKDSNSVEIYSGKSDF